MDMNGEKTPRSDVDNLEISSSAERLQDIDCPKTEAPCVSNAFLLAETIYMCCIFRISIYVTKNLMSKTDVNYN
jgi:hypothetical protein